MQFMTIKEAATALNVSEDSVLRVAKEQFPNIVKNGKTTYLSEVQVTFIKLTLSKHHNLRSTAELPKTDLEKELLIAQAMQFQQEKILALQSTVTDMTPAYEFGKYLIDARNGYMSMAEAAAILSAETGMGRNNLFAWLRGQKILMSGNIPYREYIERGYFSVTEKMTAVGSKTVTLVSNSGIAWILKQFKLSN